MTNRFFNLANKKENLLLTEKLKTLDDFNNRFFKLLPNPSKLLQRHGLSKVFTETVADTTVRGAMNTIFEGVGSLEWEIVKNDAMEEEIELAYNTIDNLMRNGITKKILYAIFYGFQPLNVIWKYDDSIISIDKVIEIPHDSVKFDLNRQLRLIDSRNPYDDGIVVDNYRLLMPVYDATYQNPYGTGLLLNCYKYVFIKNNIADFWTMFAEDYGSPAVKGSFTQAAASMFQMSPEQFVSYFYEQIEAMRGKKIIVHPEGTDIALVPGASSTSADIYNALIKFCKSEINTLLLGHEAASTSTPGKLGNDTMAISNKIDRIESYTEFITYYINVLLKWQHELNFINGVPCEIRFYEKDDIEVYTGKANLLNQLHNIGVKFNDDYIEETFNIDKKFFKIEENTNFSPFAVNDDNHKQVDFRNILSRAKDMFAKNKDENDTLGDFMDFVFSSEEFVSENEKTYNTIADELAKYDNYDDMLDNLFDIYDKLDLQKKKDIISKFMLISAIYGYNEQNTESDNNA